MAEFPALPLWTDAYLADTRHLTTEQHGAYLLLMMEAWRRPDCSLPDDDEVLARLSGLPQDRWQACRGIVLAFWWHNEKSKTWHQKRLTKERSFVTKYRASQRSNALKRWSKTKNNDAMALPSHMPNACQTHAPTPTPTYKDDVDGSAHATAREGPTFRERILAAMGLDQTGITGPNGRIAGTQADMEVARRWITDLGLSEDDAVAVVGEVMAHKRDGPPASWRYFQKAMVKLALVRDAPPQTLPDPATLPPRPASQQESRNARNDERLARIIGRAVDGA